MSKTSLSSLKGFVPQTEGRLIRWAKRYDVLVSLLTLGQASTLRAHTADLAHISSGDAVLDVGCGTGDLTREVRHRIGNGGLVAGIDAAPEMIARAQEKANKEGLAIDFRVEPIEKMSFADQTFDVIISSLMFHHLPAALKSQGVAEMKRVLKPGGRVLIVDFFHPASHFAHRAAKPISAQEMITLLSQAGFLQVEWQRGPFPLLGAARGISPQ